MLAYFGANLDSLGGSRAAAIVGHQIGYSDARHHGLYSTAFQTLLPRHSRVSTESDHLFHLHLILGLED